MRAGSVVGLVMAGFVTLVCLANLVLAIGEGTHPSEWVLWAFGVLIGLVGAVVFLRRARSD